MADVITLYAAGGADQDDLTVSGITGISTAEITNSAFTGKTLTLAGINSVTTGGAFKGKLIVDGTLTVATGQTIAGTDGTNNVVINGTLAAGADAAIITIGAYVDLKRNF